MNQPRIVLTKTAMPSGENASFWSSFAVIKPYSLSASKCMDGLCLSMNKPMFAMMIGSFIVPSRHACDLKGAINDDLIIINIIVGCSSIANGTHEQIRLINNVFLPDIVKCQYQQKSFNSLTVLPRSSSGVYSCSSATSSSSTMSTTCWIARHSKTVITFSSSWRHWNWLCLPNKFHIPNALVPVTLESTAFLSTLKH